MGVYGSVHALAQRGDTVDTHEWRDRDPGLPPRVLPHEAREPGVLPLAEREDLDERRARVEWLIVGDGAGHFRGRRIAELRGLGEGADRRGGVGWQASEQAQHPPDGDVAEVDERRNIQ